MMLQINGLTNNNAVILGCSEQFQVLPHLGGVTSKFLIPGRALQFSHWTQYSLSSLESIKGMSRSLRSYLCPGELADPDRQPTCVVRDVS